MEAATPQPTNERLFDGILLHARVRPAAVAVQDRGATLSYGELAARSSRIAAELERRGVHRGDRVAVLASKSADLMAVLYGILGRGAAYVPLSTEWPPERLRWVVSDVDAAAVVTEKAHIASVARAAPGRLLSLDEAGPEADSLRGVLDGPPTASPASWAEVTANDLAYVIYTSGSTGAPKGVMHSHWSALGFVRWAVGELGLDATDRLASHAPFNFDLSIFDIYAASRVGAALVIPDAEVATFPARFIEWLEAEQITTAYSVPGVWVAGLHGNRRAVLAHPAMRRIIYAGEAMAPRHVLELQESLPHAQIYNFYGPTETNVCTAYCVPRLAAEALPDAIPIGHACSGDTVSMEDDDLVVSGDSVFLGYWGQTRREPGEPYRTGDRVRFDPSSGTYVFLGRRDGMRKIRGFRVELGEVEACLLKNSATAEVIAEVDDHDDTHPTLVAFVVPAKDTTRDSMALKRHCARFLPPYMVPRIVWRDSMPVTATGKIDRRALMSELIKRSKEQVGV